jgi:NADPH-dependent ferric siderophore reductase
MTEAARTGTPPVLNDPFARLEGPLAGTTRMRLRVVRNELLTPAMQQVVLSAPELAGFAYQPGQDIMLMVTVDGDRPVRRRYTIRAADPALRLLTLGIVRHEDGPGERWVRAARPGDEIEGIGPRGKIFLSPGADWHLFAGDFSALPAYLTMAGSLPAGTHASAILEVPGPEDQQELATEADARVQWLHRQSRPAGDPSALAEAVSSTPLPPGTGHAYLAGEAKLVLALREALAARGMAPGQMSPKAYWGLGRANASHGEPPKE